MNALLHALEPLNQTKRHNLFGIAVQKTPKMAISMENNIKELVYAKLLATNSALIISIIIKLSSAKY